MLKTYFLPAISRDHRTQTDQTILITTLTASNWLAAQQTGRFYFAHNTYDNLDLIYGLDWGDPLCVQSTS